MYTLFQGDEGEGTGEGLGTRGGGNPAPRGVPYGEGGAIILDHKMCGAAGRGGEIEGGIFSYYFIFRSGKDYLAARLEIEEEKGTAAERV